MFCLTVVVTLFDVKKLIGVAFRSLALIFFNGLARRQMLVNIRQVSKLIEIYNVVTT